MSSLRHEGVRAARVTLVAQFVKLPLRLASMAILARLLLPEHFGLIAMVASVVSVADLFRDFGLSTATIQRKDVSDQQITNLFWINVGIGLVTAVVIAALSPAIAAFFREPRLIEISLFLAGNAFLGGLAVQHQALLKRDMKFGAQAVVDVGSLLIGIFVAIFFARMLAATYWSLVAMAIATSLSTAVLSWGLCGWRPGTPKRDVGTTGLIIFGRDMFASSLLGYIGRNLDNLLIGWRWGGAELGHYTRAYQLFMMPLNQLVGPVATVALPVLSRLQDRPEQFGRYFGKILFVVNAGTMPVAMLFVAFSDEIIALFLGDGWGLASDALFYLGVAGLFQPVSSLLGLLYIASGRTARAVRWSAYSCGVYSAAFVIGLPWGAVGVAAAYAVARLLLLWPAVRYATTGLPVPPGSVVRATVPPLIASALGAGAGAICMRAVDDALSLFVSLPLCGVVALAVAASTQLVADRDRVLLGLLRDGFRTSLGDR